MSELYQQIRDYINWAFAITAGVSIWLLARQELLDVWNEDPLRGLLVTLLLAATVARFFIYLRAVRWEIDILNRVFISDDLEARGKVLTTIVILSLLFAGLISTTHELLVYSLLAVAFGLGDLYGQLTVKRNVVLLVLENRFKEAVAPAARRSVVDYYVHAPLGFHAAAYLVAFCAAAGLALVERLTADARYGTAAYVVLVLTIVVGEVWIHLARVRLARGVAAAERPLPEAEARPAAGGEPA